MVFRNIFSAAILFFSADVAFAVAEEPADEETRRETTYTIFNPATADSKTLFARYFYDPAGNNRLTIRLPQYNGIAETESVWNHFSTGFNPGGAQGASKEDLPRPNDNDDDNDNNPATVQSTAETGLAEPEPANPAENHIAGDIHSVYDFSVHYENSITEAIGHTGRGDTENGFGVPEIETERLGNGQPPDNGVYSILVFEKEASSNILNRAKIHFEETNADMFNDDDGYKSSPLTIPIALFFFMIGAGFLLVFFTSIDKGMEN